MKESSLGNADVLDGGLHITGPVENLLEIVVASNAGRINGLFWLAPGRYYVMAAHPQTQSVNRRKGLVR